MAAYIIRNIDPKLWTRVKLRAEQETITLRQVLLLLLRAYADGLPMGAFMPREETK